MTAADPQRGADPTILAVKEKLTASLVETLKSDETEFPFFLVIAILEVVIQVLKYCAAATPDAVLHNQIKNFKNLPLLETLPVRKKIMSGAMNSGATRVQAKLAYRATQITANKLTDEEIAALLWHAHARK